jgi:hypothetical protein
MKFILRDTNGNAYRLEADSLTLLANAIVQNGGTVCFDEHDRPTFVFKAQILKIVEAKQ